jgi:hypothetical protein
VRGKLDYIRSVVQASQFVFPRLFVPCAPYHRVLADTLGKALALAANAPSGKNNSIREVPLIPIALP